MPLYAIDSAFMITTGIYGRISLDRNGEAAGVGRQVTDAEGLAKMRGWKVGDRYIDNDRSAYIPTRKRPEWDRLLADLAAGRISHVIAWASDRLYRTTEDQLVLMKAVQLAGGVIATLKDGDVDPSSAEGRMRMTILSSVAEFESSRKAERVMRAGEQRAAEGLPHGRPPFGWRFARSGEWELDPEQSKLIQEAADRVLHGESPGAIVADWNARRLPTGTRASAWDHRMLRRILRRPTNAGLRVHRKQVAGPGTWPAILEMETWESVVARLVAPRGQQRARRYLLTGVIHCGIDGGRMRGHGSSSRRDYDCATCGQAIAAERLDKLVTEALLGKLSTPRLAERLARARNDTQEADALRDLERADARLSELAKLYGAGDLDTAEWRAGRVAAQQRRSEAERRLSGRRSSKVLVETLAGGEGISEVWERQHLSWRREVVAAVIDRIQIGQASKTAWEPQRVEMNWRTA